LAFTTAAQRLSRRPVALAISGSDNPAGKAA
jgi:hypothetical protein